MRVHSRWTGKNGCKDELRRASHVVVGAIATRREAPGLGALLAKVPKQLSPGELAAWRGRVDAFAFRARYCDEAMHERHKPVGAAPRKLYYLLEQCRVEALGVRRFLGATRNIAAHYEAGGLPTGPGISLADARLMAAVLHEVRLRIGAPLAAAGDAELEHARLDPHIRPLVDALAAGVERQENFAKASLQLVAAILPNSTAEPPERKPVMPAAEVPQESKSVPIRCMAPNARRTAEGMKALHAEVLAGLQTHGAGAHAPEATKEASRYQIYTKEFDWVGNARELCTPVDLAMYRRTLDQHLAEHVGDAQRWAHRLQRHLLAQRMSSWQFDLEEGLLDCARLTRVATNPTEPLSFKQEAPADFPDTAVTVLVDNSGSMRGTPIAVAAVCADLLGSVLERCGVKCEILGFTTRAWRGGRSRQQWLAGAHDQPPGRLTDLCHIIYKNMDEPLRRSRLALAAMLNPDILKDNVDGEALLWAHERLIARPESRRILLVISDGAPLDESTGAANDPGYLDRHLRDVIAWIERSSPVELHAIGIGHDVTDYYPRAMMIAGPEELGRAMFTRLAELLESQGARARRTRRAS